MVINAYCSIRFLQFVPRFTDDPTNLPILAVIMRLQPGMLLGKEEIVAASVRLGMGRVPPPDLGFLPALSARCTACLYRRVIVHGSEWLVLLCLHPTWRNLFLSAWNLIQNPSELLGSNSHRYEVSAVEFPINHTTNWSTSWWCC